MITRLAFRRHIAKLITTFQQSQLVDSWEPLEKVAAAWGRAISKNRDMLFVVVLAMSSMVAFLPFARQTSVSNFFVYAMLPIVFVFANGQKFKKVQSPNGLWMLLAMATIIFSFLFNSLVGMFNDNSVYGLTDYVILAVGIFALFYTAQDSLVRFGILILVFVRGATLALSMVSGSLFASISSFFVGIVVFFSKIFVDPAVRSGSYPGAVIAVGNAGSQTVSIGWACAGLEELVLTSVLIFVLIWSFDLGPKRTTAWLAIGIAGSFFINIARMVILVWIAADYGYQKMLWVHTHLGDVLFLVWIGIFWLLFFRLGLPRKTEPKPQPAI